MPQRRRVVFVVNEKWRTRFVPLGLMLMILITSTDGRWSCVVCLWQTYAYEQLKSMVETRNFAPDVDRESLEVLRVEHFFQPRYRDMWVHRKGHSSLCPWAKYGVNPSIWGFWRNVWYITVWNEVRTTLKSGRLIDVVFWVFWFSDLLCCR